MRSRLDCIALRALGAAVMVANLTACSLGTYTASSPALVATQHRVLTSSVSTRLPYYICPAGGALEYVADYNNNTINVFAGHFKGHAAFCGQIRALSPWGMYVQPDNHDLYVVSALGHDILAFHRGQTSPYNTYTDPTAQAPVDVVETNGTVIASNLTQNTFRWNGSLSTWLEGPRGGRFIGNFRMADGGLGQYLTAKNGIVYFDDLPTQTFLGVLWRVSCPAGKCGTQTKVAGVTLAGPGGIAHNAADDLVVAESAAGRADTFELPNPVPSWFHVVGAPTGIAFDPVRNVLFVADGLNNDAAEYTYPGGVLVGTVPGSPGGGTFGVAVDPD